MGRLILAGIAWIYLHTRYQSNDKIKQILKDNYSNSYHSAGSVYMLHFIAFVSISAMLTGLILGIISFFLKEF